MVADRYSPVITVDLTAGDRSQVGAVSCVRVSEVRRHRRVQENARVRIGRHIIIVLDQGSGRHVVDTETYELEPESVIYIEPGRLHQWLPDEDFEGWVIAINMSALPICSNIQACHHRWFPSVQRSTSPIRLWLP